MYIYRMMSQQEYEDLIAGKTLVNMTIHDETNEFSYSTGFCFLPWEVECREVEPTWPKERVTKMTALQAVDSLMYNTGRYDVWVQLKVVNPKVLKKSRGKYYDDTYDEVWANELCTTSYSIADLRPVHAFSMRKVLDVLATRTYGIC